MERSGHAQFNSPCWCFYLMKITFSSHLSFEWEVESTGELQGYFAEQHSQHLSAAARQWIHALFPWVMQTGREESECSQMSVCQKPEKLRVSLRCSSYYLLASLSCQFSSEVKALPQNLILNCLSFCSFALVCMFPGCAFAIYTFSGVLLQGPFTRINEKGVSSNKINTRKYVQGWSQAYIQHTMLCGFKVRWSQYPSPLLSACVNE